MRDQLGVDVGQLADRVLDAADVVKLAPGVAVHELQAVLAGRAPRSARRARCTSVDEQAELRLGAGRVAPASGALAGELDAHADPRPHVVALGVLEDQVELVELLDHRNDRPAELAGEDHALDVVVVLEAVADDQPRARIVGHRQHRQQLRLGAHLEAEAVVAAVSIDLLDHRALLVDLDRVDRQIPALVVVLGHRRGERVAQGSAADESAGWRSAARAAR